LARLRLGLQPAKLPLEMTIYPVDAVLFLERGMASLLATPENGDAAEHTALQAPPRRLGERPSTALTQHAGAGVTWTRERVCRSGQGRTSGRLWVPPL
jgi:hypothetical protein